MSTRSSVVTHAFLAGAALGSASLLISAAQWGLPLAMLRPIDMIASWIHSIALYSLIGGVITATFSGCLSLLRVPRPFPWAVGTTIATCTLCFLVAWRQTEVLAGFAHDDPARSAGFAQSTLTAIAIGLVCALAIRRFAPKPSPAAGRTRRLAATLACAGVLGSLFTPRLLGPAGSSDVPVPPAKRIVLVGLDGLTWRVLSPLIRRGSLPNLKTISDQGSVGTILTYGVAASPIVWTSIATGMKAETHGIDDFVAHSNASNQARSMRSSDRQVPAIWNMLGSLEQRVAVIDWQVSWPAERVNGVLVTQLEQTRADRSWPAELADQLDEFLPPRLGRDAPSLDRAERRVERTFAAAHSLAQSIDPSFLAVYTHAADGAQHRYWRDWQPAEFDDSMWSPPGSFDQLEPDHIPSVYRAIDRHLGDLLNSMDEHTLLIVVSDHGGRPAPRPRIRLRMNRLLAILGYAELRPGTVNRVDARSSRCFALLERQWSSRIRINLNIEGRDPHGIVPAAEAQRLLDELVADLGSLRLGDNGRHLFSNVRSTWQDGRRPPGAPSDLVLDRAAPLQTPQLDPQTIAANGSDFRLSDVVEIDVGLSGAHDHQGVIMFYGRGAGRGRIGQTVIPSPLHQLLWRLTDHLDIVDRILPLLGSLRIIDPISTLDITPTILFALDHPVARDMDGVARSELLEFDHQVQWTDSYSSVGANDPLGSSIENQDEAEREILEELRALGYID